MIGLLFVCFGVAYAQPGWFSECVGYGCGAANYRHTSCVVSSATESALRSCLTNQYTHVTFTVSGRISLSSSVVAPRGTIIDGSGQSITFTGWDLFLENESIVYRVTFDTGNDDAVSLRGDWNPGTMGDIWIHKCTFTNYYDGLIDITRGVARVTISWCYFFNHDKVNLISQDTSDQHTDLVTIHHNYFYDCVQRMPRVRYAYVHVYNNVYEQLTDYAIASSQFGRVFVENNVFLPSTIKDYRCTRVDPMGEDTDNGYLRHTGNNFWSNCAVVDYMPGNVGNPSYGYSLDNADDALVNNVKANAGNK